MALNVIKKSQFLLEFFYSKIIMNHFYLGYLKWTPGSLIFITDVSLDTRTSQKN